MPNQQNRFRIANKNGNREIPWAGLCITDFTPSFKHYDVCCAWDEEDNSNKDADGISTLGYSRLLYTRFRVSLTMCSIR